MFVTDLRNKFIPSSSTEANEKVGRKMKKTASRKIFSWVMEIFLVIVQNFTLGEQILQLTISSGLGNLGCSLIFPILIYRIFIIKTLTEKTNFYELRSGRNW